MAFDYSAASGILKTVYLPALQELLNNATPLLKILEKEVTPTEGGDFKFAVHRTRNVAAMQGLAEGATLPTAGQQGYVQATVPVKLLYSRISVSGKAIAATRTNKGAFVKALEGEMKYVMNDSKRQLNRQLNGDGTGAIAFWTAADNVDNGANTAVTVDDKFGNGTTYLEVGSANFDLVDASDHATLLNTGALVVTRGTISTASTAITATGGTVAGSADEDYLVRRGASAGDGVGKEMVGLEAIISASNPPTLSGGLHGLAVASYPDWVAQILGSYSARQDLSFTLIQQLISKIITESAIDESDIKLFHCHPAMRDTYVKLCQDERVFYNVMKLDGGWEAVTYNGKPILADVHARRNRFNAITPSSLSIMQMAPLDWMDKDGSVFYRMSGGDVDAYGATLFVYQELGCKVRNQNGALLGIKETAWT
jgi:hypothetical protein